MGAHQQIRTDTQEFGDVPSRSRQLSDTLTGRHRVCLVVVEAGARRLEERVVHGESDHTVVIAQSGKEPPAEAAISTIRRIGLLELSGYSIELAILLLAPRFDVETTAARIALARALASHSASTNAGASEILLGGATPSQADLQTGVLALVDVLTRDPGSCSLPVRVHFLDRVRPQGCGRLYAAPRP